MKNFLIELENLSFAILYGSQLGQAKSIAEGLVDVAEDYDLNCKAIELNAIKDINDLAKITCPIVIVTSTTGDGEPPENADKFWRKIRKKTLSEGLLNSLKYTILGLGDTNYNNFCNCGKEIHRRLQHLGASTFYSPGWADDAIGLELVVDNWIDDLWCALTSLIHPGSAHKTEMEKGSLTVPNCPAVSLQIDWLDSKDECSVFKLDLNNPLASYPLIEGDPVAVKITHARILTKPDALKTALELTFKFAEKCFKFEPGEAVNIICPNSELEVNQLLDRLKLLSKSEKILQLSVKEGSKGKIPPFLPATITLRAAFLHYLDIRSCPKKNFIRLLSEYTSNDEEKNQLLELCSRQGGTKFEETVRFASLSLLDILMTYPSCNPPLEALLEHLPRLLPRAYSISSSSLANDQTFTTVFNIVKIPKENGRKYERLGVCSGWLYQRVKAILNEDKSDTDRPDEIWKELENSMKLLTINDEITIYRRKNQTFRLPEDNNIPLIMVGPGTGVAPFVGFLQHRTILKEKGHSGEMTLYFGCRNKSKDFLYQKELETYHKGVLTNFYPVYSRDDPEATVKYVQHRMLENKETVVHTLFDNGGHLYVCGDARNMAKDVRDVLLKSVQLVKNISEAEAKTLVAELTTQKRYLQDIWT